MQTKLEKQADQLWKNYKRGGTKFWKQYEALVATSRKAILISVIHPKESLQVLDVFIAYSQLPKVYYPELFQKPSFFESGFISASFFISIILGSGLFSNNTILGPAVLFAVFVAFRFWQREYSFNTEDAFLLDIQPDYLQFGPKNEQKRVPFKYIKWFSITKRAIKLKVDFPNRGNYYGLWKTYTIPLRKAKGEKFSSGELNALKQLLEAIVEENIILSKYKNDAYQARKTS